MKKRGNKYLELVSMVAEFEQDFMLFLIHTKTRLDTLPKNSPYVSRTTLSLLEGRT